MQEEIQSFEFGEPGQSRPGILFIHGWTSSPRELRFMAERLSKPLGEYWPGAWCLGPQLPGHGTKAEDLNEVTPTDYLKAASKTLNELKSKCRQVYIVGQSFGGAIALQLAKTHDLKGLILMAPFIHMTDSTLMGIPKRSIVKLLPETYKPIDKGEPGVADPIARSDHYCYDQVQVPALRHFFESVEEFTSDLQAIRCPTIIFHSVKDKTSDFHNSTKIIENIGSDDRRLIALQRSNHILSLDYDHLKVEQEIRAWLKNI